MSHGRRPQEHPSAATTTSPRNKNALNASTWHVLAFVSALFLFTLFALDAAYGHILSECESPWMGQYANSCESFRTRNQFVVQKSKLEFRLFFCRLVFCVQFAMEIGWPLLWLAFGLFGIRNTAAVSITLHTRTNEYRPLPRFWANVGFSPPAPLPLNRTQISAELLSDDVLVNTELIAALPNHGIEHIRIHWLLSLLRYV